MTTNARKPRPRHLRIMRPDEQLSPTRLMRQAWAAAFTRVEAEKKVALGLALEKLERPKAKERQRTLNNEETASGNFPEANSRGTTRDIVGAALEKQADQ